MSKGLLDSRGRRLSPSYGSDYQSGSGPGPDDNSTENLRGSSESGYTQPDFDRPTRETPSFFTYLGYLAAFVAVLTPIVLVVTYVNSMRNDIDGLNDDLSSHAQELIGIEVEVDKNSRDILEINYKLNDNEFGNQK